LFHHDRGHDANTPYSGFAPDALTTLPHFSVSSASILPKSAGGSDAGKS
jgi:hypothetical protein